MSSPRKSLKPNKKKVNTPYIESIKESTYINSIISNNITDKFKISFLSLQKMLPLLLTNIILTWQISVPEKYTVLPKMPNNLKNPDTPRKQ